MTRAAPLLRRIYALPKWFRRLKPYKRHINTVIKSTVSTLHTDPVTEHGTRWGTVWYTNMGVGTGGVDDMCTGEVVREQLSTAGKGTRP